MRKTCLSSVAFVGAQHAAPGTSAWQQFSRRAKAFPRVAALFDFVGVQRVVIEICSTMFQLRTQNRSYWKQPSPFCSRPRSL